MERGTKFMPPRLIQPVRWWDFEDQVWWMLQKQREAFYFFGGDFSSGSGSRKAAVILDQSEPVTRDSSPFNRFLFLFKMISLQENFCFPFLLLVLFTRKLKRTFVCWRRLPPDQVMGRRQDLNDVGLQFNCLPKPRWLRQRVSSYGILSFFMRTRLAVWCF